MDYAELIPKQPPKGLLQFLQKEGKMNRGVLGFKFIGCNEAYATQYQEDIGVDARPGFCTKNAKLWCSECDRVSLAGYVGPLGEDRYTKTAPGIELAEDYELNQSGLCRAKERTEMRCPNCGADVRLVGAQTMRVGLGEQAQVMAASVAGGCTVLTKWLVDRHTTWHRDSIEILPMAAWIIDGRKIVLLKKYQGGLYGKVNILQEWKQVSRMRDTVGAPYFYDVLPDFSGTSLENAKLQEYYDQAYKTAEFFPLGYIRAYLKHRNLENIITAGLGRMLGQAIREETVPNLYSGVYSCPRLAWMDLKAARPAKMLRLDKDRLKKMQRAGWGWKELKTYMKLREQLRFEDAVEVFAEIGQEWAETIMETGMPPVRAAHYCKKQGQMAYFFRDYIAMARAEEMDLDDDTVRWPRDLRAAHDRLATARKYATSEAQKAAFKNMSKRCEGLCWEHDGICIRPAATPEELVAEGKTLHHCVGGYASAHTEGRIILFIRHTRRPERSWFTLNVNVITKEILQNHGYGNELAHGKRLKIPQAVQDFVKEWQEQVLKKWTLPKPKKTKTDKKAAA